MKRLLRKAALMSGIIAAVGLVFLAPAPSRRVQAQVVIYGGHRGGLYTGFGQGYYGGYGRGYGGGWSGRGYSSYYGPYGYGPGATYYYPGTAVYGRGSYYYRGYQHPSNFYGRTYYPYGYGY